MNNSENAEKTSPNVDVAIKVQANLDPLVNATPKGLSTLFNLLFKKRYREAARQAELSAAQNQVDAQKILEGRATFSEESGALIEISSGKNEMRDLVREAIQEDEITNLINCAVKAANNMNDISNVEVNISQEFVNRWRNEAKFISEEAAQTIWGRILAEEVGAPNSISIRTLNVIKDLTREEAEVFREACKFVFFGEYLLDSTVEGIPISQRSYIMLKDAGLIVDYQKAYYTSTKWLETTISFDKNNPTKAFYLRVGQLFIYVEADQVKAPPSTNYWKLTKAGIEMCRIISKEIECDVIAVGKALTEKIPDLRNLVKYTIYTNVEEKEIDLNKVQPIFGANDITSHA
jgi:hypothetical protein